MAIFRRFSTQIAKIASGDKNLVNWRFLTKTFCQPWFVYFLFLSFERFDLKLERIFVFARERNRYSKTCSEGLVPQSTLALAKWPKSEKKSLGEWQSIVIRTAFKIKKRQKSEEFYGKLFPSNIFSQSTHNDPYVSPFRTLNYSRRKSTRFGQTLNRFVICAKMEVTVYGIRHQLSTIV